MSKSYDELKSALDEVLATIQSDDIGVDEAIAAYEKGMQLVGELENYLKTSENKIKKLKRRTES